MGMNNEKMQKQIEKMSQQIAFNGGVREAVDFIEYAAEFGVDHFFCNYGHRYNCSSVQMPWFQQTMIDVYFCIVFAVLFVAVCVKKCLFDKLFSCNNKEKYKKE